MARKRYKPEEIVAKIAAGRSCGLAGRDYGGRDPPDRRERGDLVSLAPGVWRAEDRAGEAPEGP